jgi:hypothetical protein
VKQKLEAAVKPTLMSWSCGEGGRSNSRGFSYHPKHRQKNRQKRNHLHSPASTICASMHRDILCGGAVKLSAAGFFPAVHRPIRLGVTLPQAVNPPSQLCVLKH